MSSLSDGHSVSDWRTPGVGCAEGFRAAEVLLHRLSSLNFMVFNGHLRRKNAVTAPAEGRVWFAVCCPGDRQNLKHSRNFENDLHKDIG